MENEKIVEEINEREIVRNWLNKCDRLDINPWEYNFINEYIHIFDDQNEISKKLTESQKNGLGLLNKFILNQVKDYSVKKDTEDNTLKTLKLYNDINYSTDEQKNIFINKLNENPILKYLYYKNLKFGRLADCDKEAFPIYKLLEWQRNRLESVRGETMNSFFYTYKFFLQLEYPKIFTPSGSGNLSIPDENISSISSKFPPHISKDSKKINGKHEYKEYFNENFNELDTSMDIWIEFLINNFGYFDKVNKNERLLKFAKLTYTIGNFIVIDYKYNGSRAGRFKEYWDLTLFDLENKQKNNWNNFIERYFLQPFLNSKNEPILFWNDHSKKIEPQSIDEMNQFLKNVNASIEERGKYITKILCEKLGETELKFYQNTLKDMSEIRFAKVVPEPLWDNCKKS